MIFYGFNRCASTHEQACISYFNEKDGNGNTVKRLYYTTFFMNPYLDMLTHSVCGFIHEGRAR